MATVTSISNFDAKDITFSKPRSLGKYEKINISKSDGKKLIIETEECFSRGVQKSDRYISYSIPLAFKNDDGTVRVLKEILQRCKDHMSGNRKTFGRCLYEKPERETTTVYPRLDQYDGNFKTKFFEKDDAEISPLKYLNVRCNARAAIYVEGILLGDTISLQLKVREVEVAPAPHVEKKKKRLLSDNSTKRRLFENNNERVKAPANSTVKESCCERSFL